MGLTAPSRNARIGLIAAAGALVLAAIIILSGAPSATPRWTLMLEAPRTAGVGVGSTVQLNGVPVGAVTRVETISSGPWQVRIEAAIDEGVAISDTAVGLAGTSPPGVHASLELETTPGGGVLPVDGSALLQGPIVSMRMRDLDERFDPVLQSIVQMSTTWTAVGESMQRWLDDPHLQQNARDLMHLAIASLDRTVEAMERFASLAANLDEQSGAIGSEVLTAARQLTETLDQTTRLVASIRAGEGTLGRLVVNPDAYNALESTAKELDRLARTLRLLVDQVREEGAGSLIAP